MSHILVVELPGGNDTDVIEAILQRGDRFTFLTSDLGHYMRQDKVAQVLQKASDIIAIDDFGDDHIKVCVEEKGLNQIQAVICIVDIRIVAAAKIAQQIGVPFLEPETAALLRDKFSVREKLLAAGLGNKNFRLARNEQEMFDAVYAIGYPVVIKPCDGYASQNVVMIHGPEDLDPLISPIPALANQETDYGLGVSANRRWLVEKYLDGKFVGVDTLTHEGKHFVVGFNEKIMFPRPSFAIRGGCFSPANNNQNVLGQYACAILDSVNFNHGAAHLEVMMTDEGPQLVEINPRLVSAKIPRLMNLGLGRNVYNDLVDLHLGVLNFDQLKSADLFAVSRWIIAENEGILDDVHTPVSSNDAIRVSEILKRKGDNIRPPFENSDRIGYVMTSHKDREAAEKIADQWVHETKISYLSKS